MYLHSIGHFHPENVIDNAFLASLDIGVDDDWILKRLGIRTRHTVLPLDYIRQERNRNLAATEEAALYTNAATGALAARMAIERAGLTPKDIGLVISGSSAPGICSPAEACSVAAELGLEVPAFDLNSACATFIAQLWNVSMMNPHRAPDFILLVQPENLTRIVDYNDRTNAVLLGDCSTAAIVSLRVPSAVHVGFTTIHSSPSGWETAVIPVRGHFRQNGLAVHKFAIRRTVEMLQTLSGPAEPNGYFVGHQSNLSMLQAVCERMDIPAERHLYNVDKFGNCGSAGAVSVLSQNWQRFSEHDHISMAVVSAGLTWGGASLKVISALSRNGSAASNPVTVCGPANRTSGSPLFSNSGT